MTLVEQTFAQAAMLSELSDPTMSQFLLIFCRSAVTSLTSQLRQGLAPEDCRADFVAAAALYALAALSETDEESRVEQLQLGDLTLRRTGSPAAKTLRSQAGLIISPYLQDKFVFKRV